MKYIGNMSEEELERFLVKPKPEPRPPMPKPSLQPTVNVVDEDEDTEVVLPESWSKPERTIQHSTSDTDVKTEQPFDGEAIDRAWTESNKGYGYAPGVAETIYQNHIKQATLQQQQPLGYERNTYYISIQEPAKTPLLVREHNYFGIGKNHKNAMGFALDLYGTQRRKNIDAKIIVTTKLRDYKITIERNPDWVEDNSSSVGEATHTAILPTVQLNDTLSG